MQQSPSNKAYRLIELLTVDSTNRYLKQRITTYSACAPQPIVCTTHQQTAGYGQRNQAWLTTEQSCIFSIALPLSTNKPLQPSLSLKVAVVLHQSLSELSNDPLFLKWPNDLYNNQGKVAGILIELSKDSLGGRWMVIGIGINRQPLTTEQQVLGAGAVAYFESKALFDVLVARLEYLDFNKTEQDYWQQYDRFKLGEDLLLLDQQQQTQKSVRYRGIALTGEALVEVEGKTVALHSGQTSLRSR